MIFSEYKQHGDKTILEVTKNGELIRTVEFTIGNQYVVNPINKQKKKHRGR